MTLEEVIHQGMLNANPKGKPMAKEAMEILENIDKYTYEELEREQTKVEYLLKFLYNIAKTYGKAKWEEAVEATRQAIVEDNNCPPEFRD